MHTTGWVNYHLPFGQFENIHIIDTFITDISSRSPLDPKSSRAMSTWQPLHSQLQLQLRVRFVLNFLQLFSYLIELITSSRMAVN